MKSSLENRAMAAYFRSATREGHAAEQVMQPSKPEVVEHNGLTYVVLSDVHGILAVYRVRYIKGEPMLKGLKRYPAALNGELK